MSWSSWLPTACSSISCWCDPSSPLTHPSIGEWAGESSVGRAASEGWTAEESTSWSVSAVYWGLRLRNRPLCVYFSLKYEWEREDSGSHCNNSWKLGPLIGIYTIPCYRALFHLDPVAKLIWEVESLSLFCWILREPSVAFCFILSTGPLLPEDSTRKIIVFFFFFFPLEHVLWVLNYWQRTGHTLCRSHHSRLRWASSCLNRSTQVSWVVSWKAYRRGVPVFIWKLYD